MRKAKFQENCWPLPCVMQLIIDRRETNQVYRLHYLPAVKTLILQQTITSWRTLFIFNNNVLTAVQSCNISLNGRESMPPFSSTLGRGQSEDGLLGTPLIWEHLASWSMSFANFRERFLTGKKKKKKEQKLLCSIFRAEFTKLLINVRSELEKNSLWLSLFPHISLKILKPFVQIIKWFNFICSSSKIRWESLFQNVLFFLQLKFNLHTITICLHLFNPFKILKAKRNHWKRNFM